MKSFLKIYLGIMFLFATGWFSHLYIKNFSVFHLYAFVALGFVVVYLFYRYFITLEDIETLQNNKAIGLLLYLLCPFSAFLIIVYKHISFQHLFNVIFL